MTIKRPGRPLKPITSEFFVVEPTITMAVLAGMKNQNRSWGDIAAELSAKMDKPISGASVRDTAKGVIQSDRIERALGLKPKTAEVPCCPDCGEAHLVGWCVKVDGPPVKPKPTYNRKRQPRPRLSIHSEYPENAALSITNAKGNDRLYIERLISYLSEYLESE